MKRTPVERARRAAAQDPAPAVLPDGVLWLPGALDCAAQTRLLAEIQAVLDAAPLFQPRMPRTGKPFSVRMSNCGPLGLGFGSGGRLSLSGDASGNWGALAANSRRFARSLARARRI